MKRRIYKGMDDSDTEDFLEHFNKLLDEFEEPIKQISVYDIMKEKLEQEKINKKFHSKKHN